jgi:hypothetical protein
VGCTAESARGRLFLGEIDMLSKPLHGGFRSRWRIGITRRVLIVRTFKVGNAKRRQVRASRAISLDRCRGLGGNDDGDGGRDSDVLDYRGVTQSVFQPC